MSYKVLARKWRPQHFRDMLGQEAVLRALVNALDTDRLHHAYLFTGMRGVGKTTIARIFAKCLNCLANGVSSNPCGECSACKDIEAGRFLDLIEVDAASRTKVDETRELLDNVPYAPASGRYKVYLIDEVHMFSTHSFNALLKTLEEPPEHVKFLLATTDPQKVPLTVLSRCLQFNLRRMPMKGLADYLGTILDAEEIAYERPALELVAAAAEGSVRDALSLVEQATAFGEGRVREAEVSSMLGRVSIVRLLDLLAALGEGDVATLFSTVADLSEYAPDFDQLLGELISLIHRIAMCQSVPGSESDETSGHERVVTLATTLAADELQLWYQIGLHARRDMPFAPDPREAFEMALLRMRTFSPGRPEPSGEQTRQMKVDGDDAAPNVASAAAAAAAAAAAVVKGQGQVRLETPETAVETDAESVVPRVDPRVAVMEALQSSPVDSVNGPVENGPVQTAAASPVAVSAASSAPTAASPETTAAASLGATTELSVDDWPQVIEAMGLAGMPRQLASHCIPLSFENGKATLQLEAGSEHMNSPRFVERLQSGMSAWSGQSVTLEIQLVNQTLETPARRDAMREQETADAARRSIDDDPIVKALVEGLEGKLDPSSVRPVGKNA